MQVTVQMIQAWQYAVIQEMYAKGATPEMFEEMSSDDKQSLREHLESQFAFTINPAILMPQLPVDHPALTGPRAVGAEAYERFFLPRGGS